MDNELKQICCIKRDGERVDFNGEKIAKAISKANNTIKETKAKMKEKDIEEITDKVIKKVEKLNRDVNVEEIQDIVCKELINSKFKEVATSYIEYRDKRSAIRQKNSKFMKDFSSKIMATNIENQNANIDEKTFSGRKGEAESVIAKQYALDYLMSPLARIRHLNNEIYIHDLDSYSLGMSNCLSIPFDKLFETGFKVKDITIRPPRSINTAFQLTAVIFQLQSLQQFGGVSATHLDWTMIPFVRMSFMKHFINGLKYIEECKEEKIEEIKKEILGRKKVEEISIISEKYKEHKKTYNYAYDMLEKETKQSIEAFYHNTNSLLSRSGGQVPFTSINYGTCTLEEGRLVTRLLLECSIDGIGKSHQTPIFPCGIFQCMKGVNRKQGDPNYDLFKLALKSTSLRLYPNYGNIDWSTNEGYDKKDPKTYSSFMGCRTYNGIDINADKDTNPQIKDGRGNCCPTTIILPTLAMECKIELEQKKEEYTKEELCNYFLGMLSKRIEEAKDILIERYKYICSQSPKSAPFMYENNLVIGYDGSTIESAMKHFTLAIGQLGLAETLQILIDCDHTENEGMEMAKRIEKLFNDKCKEYKKEYKLNFGVYYTPAENLCYTALKKFREKYGVIPKVSDRDYFTNSIHIPVWHNLTPFEKIDLEAQLTGYSNAGCITYVELDSTVSYNLETLEELVNYAMDKDIPYFAINIPNDHCLDCGFIGEFNNECPMCHSKNIQQLRRVTGYLTGNYKTAFNLGKQKETEQRHRHVGKIEISESKVNKYENNENR